MTKPLPALVFLHDKALVFDRVIAAASGNDTPIVLCHDEDGNELYVPEQEWAAASSSHAQKQSAQVEQPEPQAPQASQAPQTPQTPAAPPEQSSPQQSPQPLVTTASTSADKLVLFRSLFKGRDDVHAQGYKKREGGIGYSPVCLNRWDRAACPKFSNRKAKCGDCKQRQFKALDDKALIDHFQGRDPRFRDVIGIYPLDEDCNTSLLAIDLDKCDWKKATAALRQAASELGVVPCIERSRSGNGAHAWFFFSEPISGKLARDFGSLLLTKAAALTKEVSFESYDRMFPTQDTLPKGGLGNLIALPLQGAAMKNGNSLFVDESFTPYPDQWRFLSQVAKLDASFVERIIESSTEDVLGALAQNDEAPKHPWERTQLATLSASDFPGKLEIVDAGTLYIPSDHLSPAAANRIRRLAAFANPEFYRAQAMHQSVYGKPRIINLGEERDGFIMLPRGCKDGLLTLLENAGAEHAIKDERAYGRPIDMSFAGTLRPAQQKAVESMLAHDNGMLSAPTGFGKTVAAAAIISEVKLPTLVIVPSTTLMAQWSDKLAQFLDIRVKLEPLLTPSGKPSKKKRPLIGQIGGGKRKPSGIIDIATFQSLTEKDPQTGEPRARDIVGDYGLVICDECHHAAAPKLELILKAAKARCVYGLSATPQRSDGLNAALAMLCGPIRFKGDPKAQMREQGMKRLLLPRFTGMRFPKIELGSSFNQVIDELCASEARNELIVREVTEAVGNGRAPLVLSKRKGHAQTLCGLLERAGCSARLLVGGGTLKQRREKLEEALRELEVEGTSPVFVATDSYLGEGFDASRLDALFLATPVSWDGRVTQQAGRLHRTHEGKNDVVIYDYVDASVPALDRMHKKRLRTYAKLGYEVVMLDDGTQDTGSSRFIDSKGFMEALAQDIASAGKSIFIAAPYHTAKAVALIAPLLGSATSRGIEVVCTSQKAWDEESRALLEDVGARLSREAAPGAAGFAVFDEEVVWYGTLPLLSFPKADDVSIRFKDARVAYDLAQEVMGTQTAAL